MNVIAFLGSPREGGNTETLLRAAIEGTGQDARVFDLNRMDIKPCLNCGECEETGACILEDDMGEIYKAIRGADRIILASPIFFMGVSAQCKAMIDRCQAFWCEKHLLKRSIEAGEHGRKGLLLLVGGMEREDGIRCAGITATAFFRTVSVPEHRTLAYRGVDARGEILKHPNAMGEAREAGEELVK
jgi:multimeric flavodoxin WrbA